MKLTYNKKTRLFSSNTKIINQKIAEYTDKIKEVEDKIKSTQSNDPISKALIDSLREKIKWFEAEREVYKLKLSFETELSRYENEVTSAYNRFIKVEDKYLELKSKNNPSNQKRPASDKFKTPKPPRK